MPGSLRFAVGFALIAVLGSACGRDETSAAAAPSCESQCGSSGWGSQSGHAACVATCEDDRDATSEGNLLYLVGRACDAQARIQSGPERGSLGVELDPERCAEVFADCRGRCRLSADECEVCARRSLDLDGESSTGHP